MEPASNDSSFSQARQARREVLWRASHEQQATEKIDLFSDAFHHEVHGFHLVEALPDGRKMRWMSSKADFILDVRSESLCFEARSGVAKNVLTVLIQGRTVFTFDLSFEWQSAAIDLKPHEGREVRVEFQTSRTVRAPQDPRELSVQFSQLYTAHQKHGAPPADSQVHSRTSISTPAWFHPELPELPPYTERTAVPPSGGAGEAAPSSVLLAVKFFRPFDATSEEILSMVSLLRQAGMQVHLACEQADETCRPHLSSKEEIASQIREENSILILHHGTAWDYGKRLMQHSRARIKMLRYHNVSRSETFLKYPAGYLEPTIVGRFETTDLAREATHFTAPVFWALGDLLACGAAPEKLLYLPFLHDLGKLDGIDAEPVPAELRNDDRFKLLVLGRQLPSKGLHHCLRVLGHYRQQYGEGISMHFVGVRDPLHGKYFQELDQLVAEHGLAGMVSFHPEVNRTQVAAWLRGCDALLTMSESEAACIPILEAGWFGKPILGFQCGGKAENAGPGQFLFESLDPVLHATAWHKLATDPALRTAVGHLARQHVQTYFSTAKIHARFLEVIQQISGAKI
ncbi:MAG TPA: glycosyltransferase family 4 protein [Candidatus Saccharimonadia bacterium]|nr:glycosyltransferase family 4 protein [Candidatus Saccharimonadia bacterium]